ncbi:MAG: EAL domain-containing protein [Oceanospirillales bacterium]|nr:MAG: EAL domain-containing protein [Oceanospirillales bacterium]
MSISRYIRQSLKARITITMLAILMVCVVSLAWLVSKSLQNDMQNMLGEQQLSTTSLIANGISKELESRIFSLEQYSKIRIEPFMLADPDALQERLEGSSAILSMFNAGIFVTHRDGQTLASVPSHSPTSVDSGTKTDTRELLHDEIEPVFNEGKAHIGKPYMDEQFRSAVFHISVPIFNPQGSIEAAITGVINLKQPNFFDNITHNSYGKSGGFLLISPKDHLIITATNPDLVMTKTPPAGVNKMYDRILLGMEEYGVAINSRGVVELSAAKRIPIANWFLVTVLPTEEAFAPIRSMQKRMLWMTLFLAMLAGTIMWLILRREFSAMLSAVKALTEFKDTHLPLKPIPVSHQDEIGELINSFNQLIESLQSRDHKLRQSQAMLMRTEQIAHVGSWDWDIETDTVTWSDELYRIFDRNPEDGAPSFAEHAVLYDDTDLKRLQEVVSASLKDGTPYEIELRARRQNGESRICLARGHTKRDLKNKIIGLFGSIQDVTDLRRSEEDLSNLEELMRYVVEHTNSAVAIHDKNLHYIYVSQRYLNDYHINEENIIGKHHYEVFPNLPQKWKDAHQLALSGISTKADADPFLNEDGRQDWTRWECKPWFLRDGSVGGIIIYTELITERIEAENKLKLAAEVFNTANEGILITDTDANIIQVNEAFTFITGYTSTEVIGKNPRILSSGRQDQTFYAELWQELKETGRWHGEIWNRRRDGELYAEMLSISTARDSEGNPQHYVALFSDVTSIKKHHNQLEYIAHYDVLTNLPNRVLLSDRLHQAMAQSRRNGNILAVAYLDLDGFKSVNDTHGHHVGDEVLVEISKRLKECLRDGDTLARIGGDEFIAVLVDLAQQNSCHSVIERLLDRVCDAVYVEELALFVSASVGVTFFPQDEDVEADQLYRQADQAMYQAKLAGKNCYAIFDLDHDVSLRSHHEKTEDIRHALNNHQLVLHYQPKVNMRSGELIGVEALIRWHHPSKGLLAPSTFLPIIEEHPLAIVIGEWVINTALTQIEYWRSIGLKIPISINIGARQLQQPNFIERLNTIMLNHPNVCRGDLEIEVLETSALEDINLISELIQTCRKLGITFALDDFGTGYSSLTYLKRLAVNVLKIDQSFVRDMLDDPDDLAILISVIGLAKSFHRQVIAEGVESIEHGKLLLQLGCELAQGYVIAKPMPAEEILSWISSWKTPLEWQSTVNVNQAKIPTLYSIVEHRAWINSIRLYIKGELSESIELDSRKCGFYYWLEEQRKNSPEMMQEIQVIDSLHERLHHFAGDLCQHYEQGCSSEISIKLIELERLSDQFLEKLTPLLED